MRSVFVLLALAGCPQDQGLGKVKDTDAGDGLPDILVEPDHLYFDTLDMGQEATQSFTITNLGDANLLVSSMTYFGTAAFAVQTSDSAPTIEPGETVTVDVRFAPVGPEDRGEIHILNNDPGSPEPLVYVEGTARVPELVISPDPLDFGNVLIGCSRTEPLRFSNVGEAPLVISSIAQVGDGFSLELPFTLPVTIDPGDYREADLILTPTEDTLYTSEVFVSANTTVGTQDASQDGAGTLDGDTREEFWQGDGPWDMADIIFYVDQSCSMNNDKAIITANFESFAARLESLDVDWQVGVAIRDNGCFAHGILTPDTPSIIETFTDAVEGWGGDSTEAGFAITRNAIFETSGSGCNAGFVREGAKTTIILVSDEVEQSGISPLAYVDDIHAIAPTATVTSIVGDYPNGCATADPGIGYYDATVATGGAFLSICASDWSPYFETIATMTASGLLDSFALTSVPDPATISVMVDDVPQALGWAYDSVANAIVFEDAYVPEPGAHIVVDFTLAGDCGS